MTPWTAACQASLSFIISQSLLKLMSIELVIVIQPSHPLSPSSPPALNFPQPQGFFPNESALCIRWPKYWSFSISSSNEYSGLISFRIDCFNLLAVQGILKNFLQHHCSNASILQCSAFLLVQLSYPYMTTGKNCSFDYMDLCQQSDVSAF